MEDVSRLNPHVTPNILDLVFKSAADFPDRTALSIEEKGQFNTCTYSEMLTRIQKAAAALRGLGINPGMRIVLLSESSIECVITYFAILSCQAVPVILDTNLEQRDYEWLIHHSAPSALGVSDKFQSKLEFVQSHPVFNIQNNFSLLHHAEIPPQLISSDPCAATLLYTSGTTGLFKGVLLSHANLIFAAQTAIDLSNLNENDSMVSLLPFYHVYGLTCTLLAPLTASSRITFVEKLQGTLILKAMQQSQCTILVAVPRLLEMFANNIMSQVHNKNVVTRFFFSTCYKYSHLGRRFGYNFGRHLFKSIHHAFGGHLRVIISGGASLDKEIFNRLATLGFHIQEGYGLTETTSLTIANPINQTRMGTVGVPVPGVEMKLANTTPTGDGEIILRGPNIMLGYFQDDEANQLVLRDGWLHTGDLAKLDNDGYVIITGRIKELIVKSNGEKAMPGDVESRYSDINEVAELAVIGMPAKSGSGEEIHAAIVLNANAQTPEKQEEIKKAIAERSQQVPSTLRIQECHFVTELPRTTTLKVKRKELVKQLLARQAKVAVSDQSIPWEKDEISQAIFKILNELLQSSAKPPLKKLNADLSLQFDLGLDSLQRIELAQKVQEELSVTFNEQQLSIIYNISDLIYAVRKSLDPLKDSSPGLAETISTPSTHIRLNQRTKLNYFVQNFIMFFIKKILQHYFKLKAEGKEHLPKRVPYIICANHTSLLDGPTLVAASGLRTDNMAFIAAKDFLFDKGFKFHLVNYVIDLVPFERNIEIVGMLQGIKLCKQHIDRGNKLVIFPEATRSFDGKLQKFKSAAAMIAYELNLPIVPAYISGTYDCLPKGRRLPRKGNITVKFGKPISMQDFKSTAVGTKDYQIYKTILTQLQESIESLA